MISLRLFQKVLHSFVDVVHPILKVFLFTFVKIPVTNHESAFIQYFISFRFQRNEILFIFLSKKKKKLQWLRLTNNPPFKKPTEVVRECLVLSNIDL